MSNSITGIEQGRAKFAYDKAKAAAENKGNFKAEEYKAYVKKLPMMIKSHGLGPAIAFFYSKKKSNSYKQVYKDVEEWITKHNSFLIAKATGSEFVDKIITLDSFEYRAVTNEVLALLNWIKRFADGMIEKDAPQEK